MKRPLEELNYAELCDLSHLVQERALAVIAPLHQSFFVSLEDVFFDGVLEFMARQLPFYKVVRLSLVCRRWAALVERVTHCILQSDEWHKIHYEKFFARFKCFFSIHARPNILIQYLGASPSTVTRLVIDNGDEWQAEEGPDADISQWTQLCTLEARDFPCPLLGLDKLTRLTDLSITFMGDDSSESSLDDIQTLTQLKALSVWDMHTLDVTPLTQLDYLYSNSAHHFVHYTGDGDLYAQDDVDVPLVHGEAMMSYDGHVQRIECHGRWTDGVFTGVFCSHSEEHFHGVLLNGRRHGHGTVTNYEIPYRYEAQWQHGQLHGTLTRFDPAHLWSKCTPMVREQWDRGVLVISSLLSSGQ